MWAPAFNQKDLMRYWATRKQMKKWKREGFLYRRGKGKIIGIDYLKENKNKDYSSLVLQIGTPILIIHGKKDETVPMKFSRKIARENKNVEMIALTGADHNFEDYYIQKKLIGETINQIKKCLK